MALSLDTTTARIENRERHPESIRSRAVRSPSLSSDVKSTRSGATATLPDVNPPPAFVATAEASQLVSAEADDTILVKDQALSLLNSFLDQILYNILATAKSIQLVRLRDTVPLVLKPRLGKAALAAADEELKEYLNDGDDELLNGNEAGSELRSDFNLELAWKLARLRCMVYTRLGDMEEEDEEEHIEAEELHPSSGIYSDAVHRASSVQAAGAIFLTSILEYLGEQALLYALQNTQRRSQAPKSPIALQLSENGPMSPPIHQSMVLDEADMFYVGRESPLSRLWRSWRRQTRPHTEPLSQQISPIANTTPIGGSPTSARQRRIDEYVDHGKIQSVGLPHQIPLPMSANDVNEIEVPGLARTISDGGASSRLRIPIPERSKKRPVSMIISTPDDGDQTSPDSPQTTTVKQKRPTRPNLSHHRSISHPGPEKKVYVSGLPDNPFRVQGSPERRTNERDGFASRDFAPSHVIEQSEKTYQNKEESLDPEASSSAGVVAASVSAAVGLAGAGTLAAVTHVRDESENQALPPQTKHIRTAGDEMIGVEPQVSPPADAVTGSSITSVGDFDNMHIPLATPQSPDEPKRISRPESSDPEDLALSSADEEGPGKSAPPAPLSNSTSVGIGYPPPQTKEVPISQVETTKTDSSGPASHVSKSTVPEGTLFGALHEASKKESSPPTSEPDRPVYPPVENRVSTSESSTRQVITKPLAAFSSTETAANRASASSIYETTADDTVGESVASRPGSGAIAVQSAVPPRVSSDRSRSGHRHTGSKASQFSQHSKSSSSSSKLLGFTRDNDGRPQTGTFHDVVTSAPKSTSSNQPSIGKETWSGSSRSTKGPLRVQTGASYSEAEAEAKKKSLEILIRGDETLHYTLTPVSARADNLASPGLPTRDSSGTGTPRNASMDSTSVRQPSRTTLPPNAVNGLRIHPVDEIPQPSIARARNAAYESSRNTSSSPTASKPRTNRAQPRDARLDNTTMLDLADYARSTGPDNEQQLPKALSSRPGTSNTTRSVKSPTNSAAAMPAPPVPTNRPATQQSQASKKAGGRPKFEAREPTVSRRSGTKELIQFLRDGPPASSPGVNGVNVNGRASAASTQTSSVAPRSFQESTNSSTALLASNRAQSQNANGNASTAQRQLLSAQRETRPARKQHRARDPYAIDDSDEEIEEQTPISMKKTQDESLIDFLRNTAPPPGSTPAPILAASSSVTASGATQRDSSRPGIRDRILRSASKSSLNRRPSVSSRQGNNYEEPPQYYRSGGGARESSPHLAQSGKKIDSYKPTSITHAAHVERNRNEKMSSRPPTASGRTGTADLADYLRNSGPPERPGGSMHSSSAVREEAGFLKFFSRRKATKGH